MAVEKSDFGKAVAGVYRGLREHVESMPVVDGAEVQPGNAIDRSVKEQVISDIDRHISESEKS